LEVGWAVAGFGWASGEEQMGQKEPITRRRFFFFYFFSNKPFLNSVLLFSISFAML
jgi:hypothetical protein